MSMKQVGLMLGGLVVVAAILIGWSLLRNPDSEPPHDSESAPTSSTVMPAHDATDHITEDPYAPNDRIEHTAERVIAEMYSFTPREDDSPRAGMVRGQQYMTGKLLEGSQDSPDEMRLSSTWTSWAESGDFVTTAAVATAVDLVSDTEGNVDVYGRQTVMGTGIMIPLAPFTARVHLVLVDGIWLADSFEIIDGAPTV